MKNNKLYNVWRQIIYRCSENYFQKHLYFDKNISVCENWLNFATIRQRINNGWTVENAFDKPIKKGKYKRVNFDIETMKNKINGKR